MELLHVEKTERVITEETMKVNPDAMKEIAIALLSDKFKIQGYEIEHSGFSIFHTFTTTTELELLVGDKYKITIETTKRG
jgi:hypothetical protein